MYRDPDVILLDVLLFGGVYATANWEDLTILRAFEWDRINFATAQKRKKTAEQMRISEGELLEIRRATIANAQKSICKSVH